MRETVSGILKRVDQLVKDRKLDEALLEADRAKEIDPLNVYAHAYEERITNLRRETKARSRSTKERRGGTTHEAAGRSKREGRGSG